MQTQYIIVAILALFLIVLLLFLKKKQRPQENLSTLAGIPFAFIIAGVVFGENRIIGYSLMGVGIIIAIVDIFLKEKKK